jgi:demethylmenaquinone methyltransferase/2-methoxy-6-polyprenyl-1,4-benzoquinol methylase
MAASTIPRPGRVAADGTPYPDRDAPGFERSVRAMFTHIARGYDAFDHLASLGQDFLWRPRALWDVDRFRSGRPVGRILDVGCGPGSLSFLAADHYPDARLVGADFTMAMVERAYVRARASRDTGRLSFDRASALDLPFRGASFDLAMSAFVVRNLPDLPRAFGELRRVLRPGGTLLTLEITEPTHPLVRWGFHQYFDTMVPFLGELVGSEGPYRYLPESLRRMPDRSGMLDLLRAAGFDRVEAHPQSLGIVTAYLAGVAP